MGIKGISTVLLGMALLSGATAWGAELHGRSSTQLLWYNDVLNGSMADLAQYLRIAVSNIDGSGKASVYGYGRGAQNLGGGEGLTGRLYYLYGEYKGLYDKVDMRIGRQFSNVGAGSAIIDGAQVELKNIGPVGITAFGGREVVFGIDRELDGFNNYAMGGSAYLLGYPKTDLELSWMNKWDHGATSRSFVGGMLRQYLYGLAKIYGNARYDVAAETFNEVLAGAKFFPTTKLVITTEWFQSYPTFDTTSIYSVFAVDRFQQGVIRAEYTVNDQVSVSGGYNHEIFGGDGNADLYQIGIKVRPIDALIVSMEYDGRKGYGGNLHGMVVDANYSYSKELDLAAGINYDIYQREYFADGSHEENAQKYWLAGKYKPAKEIALSLRVEDNVNVLYHHDWRGRFVFDYNF